MRRPGQQGPVRPGQRVRGGRQRDLRGAVLAAPARVLRPADPARATRRSSTSCTATWATGPATTGRSRSAARRARSAMPTCAAASTWTRRSRWSSRAPPPADIVALWPRAQEFGFPDETAAFALQYGHGVGLSIWEKPIFSRLVSLDHPETLEEGMVFALETYWPASDGWSAARIEEELVVTADGCEVITKFPAEELLVAGRKYWTAGGRPEHAAGQPVAPATVPLERGRRERGRPVTAREPSGSGPAVVADELLAAVRADGGDPADREGRARPVPGGPGQGHHPPGRRPRGGGGRGERGAAARRLRVRHLPRPPPRDRARRDARPSAWPS